MSYFDGEKINLRAIEKWHLEMVRECINNEEITSFIGGRFPNNSYEQKLW